MKLLFVTLLAVVLAANAAEDHHLRRGLAPDDDNGNGNGNGKAKKSVRMYIVDGSPVDNDKAGRLSKELGLPTTLTPVDGGLDFVDPNKIEQIPTIQGGVEHEDESGAETEAERLSVEALQAMNVLDEEEARNKVTKALQRAGLNPKKSVNIKVSHSMLESAPSENRRLNEGEGPMSFVLDTYVSFEELLDDDEEDANGGSNGKKKRFFGPGSKVNFELNGQGETTSLQYKTRNLKKGPKVQIESAEDVSNAHKNKVKNVRKLAGKTAPAPDVYCDELVYYAPPLDKKVNAIYPYYLCKTEELIDGNVVQDTVMLPATATALHDPPVVDIDIEIRDCGVSAEAIISGGTAPYTIDWTSATSEVGLNVPTNSPTISYEYLPRSFEDGIETLYVQVTDDLDVSVVASATVQFPATCSRRVLEFKESVQQQRRLGTAKFGVEYIGVSGGLPNSKYSMEQLASRMRAHGNTQAFFWGDSNAWEQDFKDPDFGGTDHYYADDVDLCYFRGHGNKNGLAFTDTTHDDTFLHYTDAKWGNKNLEWLVANSCSMLEGTASQVRDRWGRTFHGLHMILAFENLSYNTKYDGKYFADYLGAGYTVKNAWKYAERRDQPDSVRWAVFFPERDDGVTNLNDRLWGEGSVGPDIPRSRIRRWWKYSGPC